LQKFICSFLVVFSPLHAIVSSGKSSRWGKNHRKVFDEMKIKTDQEPMLVLPKFHNESGYSMGASLMQGGRIIFYHSKVFHGEVLNFPTYDKDLYALYKMSKSGKSI
jgi:hypothetical protein